MTRNRKQGSVLLLTLFLVALAAFALTAFIEKAFSEIMTEAIHVKRTELRMEAYSALEATAAVLFNVQRMDGQLHAPEQGWDDPFALGGIEFPEEFDVHVTYIDEMGKIPLPAANREQLMRLFEVLGFDDIGSQELTDALLAWTNLDAAESSFDAHHLDYERSEIPYRPPYRPLNSFYELAAIAGFRETFFNENGDPNALFHRFTSLVSLYRFDTINVNSASPAVLRIWSDVGENEAANIERQADFRSTGKPYFETLDEAAAQLGVPLTGGYGVSTQCVQVIVTVSDGVADFVLSATLAPAGQADALRPPSQINSRNIDEAEQSQNPRQDPRSGRRASRGSRRGDQQQAAQQQQPQQELVPYPFRFLEIRENKTF